MEMPAVCSTARPAMLPRRTVVFVSVVGNVVSTATKCSVCAGIHRLAVRFVCGGKAVKSAASCHVKAGCRALIVRIIMRIPPSLRRLCDAGATNVCAANPKGAAPPRDKNSPCNFTCFRVY